jgi:hypothetical protein
MFTVVRVLCRASSRQVRGGSSFRRVVAAAGEKRVLLALSPPAEFAGCEVRQLATHAQIPPALEYEDNKVKFADCTHCVRLTNFDNSERIQKQPAGLF